MYDSIQTYIYKADPSKGPVTHFHIFVGLPEADIAALLHGEQLLHLLLDTAGDVLVHVHKADRVGRPEGQAEVLDGSCHREPGG